MLDPKRLKYIRSVEEILYQGVLLVAVAAAIGCIDASDVERSDLSTALATPRQNDVVLDYGPILRAVEPRSARFLFHAARPDGTEVPWTAGIEIAAWPAADPDEGLSLPSIEVGPDTDFVAHLTVEGLEPQTRYVYVPLVDGRREYGGESATLPSFITPPDLGELNADFTTAFFADQHMSTSPQTPPMQAYETAARQQPLFWAQLGDVADGGWLRAYGAADSPQAHFARAYPLNLATISDHEIVNNFSMNWHQLGASDDKDATLHDRVELYDRSMDRWWNYFGWGRPLTDRLGKVASSDYGESVMAALTATVIEDTSSRQVCVEEVADAALGPGSFVFLVDNATEPFHTRVARVGSPGECGAGSGRVVMLEGRPQAEYRRNREARLGVGARYAQHGHYHSFSPFPFVEFFLLDTTSYRGDTYQKRRYHRRANRETDHSLYPWDPGEGSAFIFRDAGHGANRTTDGVRSWLGPAQKAAFLEAIASSRAPVLVVAAGYPLYSAKFEWSEKYWEARESGFDFADEAAEITSALERTGKLVLWVHGDGHTPMLVRLKRNLHQLQVGATLVRHREYPGHRSRTLSSGDQSDRDSLGGGILIAGHQPDLGFGDNTEDIFLGHLDQFEGFLRLYFHPGREVLRSSERAGLRRGESDHVVEIPVAEDPATGGAGKHIIGKVARLHFGTRSFHSVIESYGFEHDRVRLELRDGIVTQDPDLLRVIIDGNQWVEAKWFDSSGREWREFSTVLRRESPR